VEALRDEILAAPRRRITFARFMERALAEPGLGYYATSQLRPTRGGDFLTAPELHPFFGRCLARFVAAAWKRAGHPRSFVVHEHGAGRGRLREEVLAGLAVEAPALGETIAWLILDLPGWAGHGPSPLVEPQPGPERADLVLANEYLDALPVHRLVQTDGLQEAWVTWRDGWFAEVLGEPSEAGLAAHLAADGVTLRPGQRAEVCLAAPRWITAAAGTLRPGGVLLVIDYGHEAAELHGPQRQAGSLLTYRAHHVGDDPFAAVGRSDITAHVDLSALGRAAEVAGLSAVGRTSQARFLADLGLGDLLATLGRDPATPLPAYLVARSAVARLLDPRHLGAFAVMAWERPGETSRPSAPSPGASLPGFGAAQ
jgi:SAM-dependent MidA family methyltransferase